MKTIIYKSAFILSLSSLLSRGLGVIRDHLLARFFGAGGEGVYNLDVYFAAFRLPDFVYSLLVMGTISAAFVPILSGIKEDKKGVLSGKRAGFTSNVFSVFTVFVAIMCVIIFILAPVFVSFIVPGFDQADTLLTVKVTRCLLLSPIFLCMSAVFQSAQNAYDRFFYYALAPVLYNISIIISIFYAKDYGVYALAVGVVIGAFLHFAIQIPGIKSLGFSFKPQFDLKGTYLREMITLTLPRVIGMSAVQVNLIFDTIVTSLLVAGSVSILNYSVNLSSLPSGVIGVSFAIASFAALSKSANTFLTERSEGSRRDYVKALNRTLSSVVFFVTPAIFGLFVLREEIVQFILEFGEFTPEDTLITVNVLGVFLTAVFAQSIVPVLARSFYTLKNTYIPVCISVICMILNISLNYFFALKLDMSVYGVALATSISVTLNMIILIIMLRSKYVLTFRFIPLKTLAVSMFASLLMGLLIEVVSSFNMLESNLLSLLMYVVLGVITYVALVYPFKLREVRALTARL